jgi:hypothetical protein
MLQIQLDISLGCTRYETSELAASVVEKLKDSRVEVSVMYHRDREKRM